MISNFSLLQNEASFDEVFCDVVIGDRFSIYYNSHFSDDPIFNHIKFDELVLDSDSYKPVELTSTFEEIITQTRSIQIPASLYVERFWKNAKKLEKDAIDFGFMIIEQMHVLRKDIVSHLEAGGSPIEVFSTKDVDLWNGAFAKSFGIPEIWISELRKRLVSIVEDPKTILLIAREVGLDEASGCTLLQFEPSGCMGVYCVGTIPERRARGVARAMMESAEVRALERNCETMVLQTLASDGVTPMYLKMGFETAFERDVLQFR